MPSLSDEVTHILKILAQLSDASRRSSDMLMKLPYYNRAISECIHRVCFAATAKHLEIDTNDLRELAEAVLRIEYLREDKFDWSLDVEQAVAVMSNEAVSKSFNLLGGVSLASQCQLQGGPSARDAAYLGIIVPSPRESRRWVVRSNSPSHGLFELTKTEKAILFELWSRGGECVRTEDLCLLVWGDKTHAVDSRRDALNFHIHRLRRKTRDHGIAIARNHDQKGYALLVAEEKNLKADESREGASKPTVKRRRMGTK